MLAEQKKMYEEQVKKNRSREQQLAPAATPPLIKGVVVVEINENNRGQVSTEHHGMIVNPNGTLSRTPQYETWVKNKVYQLKRTYETTPRLPEYLNSIPGHPSPTNLDLKWTYMGDWYDVPINPDHSGTEGGHTRVARISSVKSLHPVLPGFQIHTEIHKSDEYSAEIWVHQPRHGSQESRPGVF